MSTSKNDASLAVVGASGQRYVWSPFVNKLEARLRFDKVAYKIGSGSPKSAPKGKLPYIEVELNGTKTSIGDSTLIANSLIENGTLTDFNAKLSPVQEAQDAAIRALLEDRIYFFGMREKWCDNYITMRSAVLAALPWPMQVIVGLIIYRGISSTLYGQGVGRYTEEEIMGMKRQGWAHINALLTEARRVSQGRDGPFWVLGGDEPTEADATIFGFVASSLICDA